MLFDLNTAAEALDDLLEQERRLILDGRIVGLTGTTALKERLLVRLAEQTDTPQLVRLRAKAERNQALLAAASRGLKAAGERLAALSTTSNPLRTYGADGAALDLPRRHRNHGVNHRA